VHPPLERGDFRRERFDLPGPPSELRSCLFSRCEQRPGLGVSFREQPLIGSQSFADVFRLGLDDVALLTHLSELLPRLGELRVRGRHIEIQPIDVCRCLRQPLCKIHGLTCVPLGIAIRLGEPRVRGRTFETQPFDVGRCLRQPLSKIRGLTRAPFGVAIGRRELAVAGSELRAKRLRLLLRGEPADHGGAEPREEHPDTIDALSLASAQRQQPVDGVG